MASFDPSLAVQAAIRARLLASPELMAMVPAGNVLDVNARPEVMPAIIIGEGGTTFRDFSAVTSATLHVWFAEPGLKEAKEAVSAIVGAVRVDAQCDGVLRLPGFIIHDMTADRTHFMRDPHGPFSHAVVSVSAIVQEV